MNPFSPKSKKLARLKAARKKLPKTQRAFFLTLLMAVTMHMQTHLLEQTFVPQYAAQEDMLVIAPLHLVNAQV
jgi:hypothetical protein